MPRATTTFATIDGRPFNHQDGEAFRLREQYWEKALLSKPSQGPTDDPKYRIARFRADGPNRKLSMLDPTPVCDGEGKVFLSAENFYHWLKGVDHKVSQEVLEQIRRASTPKEAKRLGSTLINKRYVVQYRKWRTSGQALVALATAVRQKYRSPSARAALKATGDDFLLEVTPCPFWGAGIKEEDYLRLDPREQDPKHLPGRNWTGILMMAERDAIREEDEGPQRAAARTAAQQKERRVANLQRQREEKAKAMQAEVQLRRAAQLQMHLIRCQEEKAAKDRKRQQDALKLVQQANANGPSDDTKYQAYCAKQQRTKENKKAAQKRKKATAKEAAEAAAKEDPKEETPRTALRSRLGTYREDLAKLGDDAEAQADKARAIAKKRHRDNYKRRQRKERNEKRRDAQAGTSGAGSGAVAAGRPKAIVPYNPEQGLERSGLAVIKEKDESPVDGEDPEDQENRTPARTPTRANPSRKREHQPTTPQSAPALRTSPRLALRTSPRTAPKKGLFDPIFNWFGAKSN